MRTANRRSATPSADRTGSSRPEYAVPRLRDRPRRALAPIALAAGAAVLGGLLEAAPARAVEFGNGGLRGSIDTTISQGMTFRVGKRNGTLAGKTNSNDGNLNHDRGIVANTSKFTTDLDLRTDRFGAFVRTFGFIDHENRDGKLERTELSDEAKERVGSDIGVLDAYVTVPFEAGDAPVDLRLGKHVLNWGESTFIPNGINAINPFDVSKLRLPGSELREALLPVWMASAEAAADRHPVGRGLLPVRLGGDPHRPGRQLFLGHRLCRTGGAGGGAQRYYAPGRRPRVRPACAPAIAVDLAGLSPTTR